MMGEIERANIINKIIWSKLGIIPRCLTLRKYYQTKSVTVVVKVGSTNNNQNDVAITSAILSTLNHMGDKEDNITKRMI